MATTDHKAAAEEIFATMVQCVDAFVEMINAAQTSRDTIVIQGEQSFMKTAKAVEDALDTYSKYEKEYGASVRN